MLKIDENRIYLTRGDTAYLFAQIDDEEIKGTISLTVKKDIAGEELISKTIPIGESFVLVPEDTKDLDYGKYYYDVQINTDAGEIFTVIEKTPFYLREEVKL